MVEKNSKEMAKIAVAALEEKKAKDIKILDISGVSVLAIILSLPPEATATRYRLWLMRHRRSCTRQDMKQNRWKDIRPLIGS